MDHRRAAAVSVHPASTRLVEMDRVPYLCVEEVCTILARSLLVVREGMGTSAWEVALVSKDGVDLPAPVSPNTW